jgi:hypothetical protein
MGAREIQAVREISASALRFITVPPTHGGRLHVRFDSDGSLEIQTNEDVEWPYGINIDNSVVLDFDESRRLANIDVLAPPDAWEVFAEIGRFVSRGKPADLLVSEESLEETFREDPVDFFTDAHRTVLIVSIGKVFPWNDGSKVVELSSACAAVLAEGVLTAIIIHLPM